MEKMISNNEMGYLEYFGLQRNPFPVAPDDDHFFISNHIEQILAEIIHGFIARKGFMVLSGDTGLGKTSISRRILRLLEEKGIETSLVFHTSCRNIELLREINRDFGLETGSLRFGDLLNALSGFLTEKNKNNQNCAIIVDDAQNLDPKSLELIRMISNYEADQKKLVQILLIGQPELLEKLNQPELRQLKSRIIIWQNVTPLLMDELESYLFFKLNLSGSNGQIHVSRPAVKAIFRLTHGNLRQINILMDRCLYAAYLAESTALTKKIVKEAYQDIHPLNEPGKSRRKPVLVSAYIILFLIFVFYSGSIYLPSAIEQLSFIPSVSEKQVAPNTGSEKLPLIQSILEIPPIQKLPCPILQKPPELHASIQTDHFSSQVSSFLKAYQLISYEIKFLHAIHTNNFQEISGQIYDQTGYRMIRFKGLPAGIKGRYDVLVRNTSQSDEKEYILFWHPDPEIDNFYYGYQGDEIRSLQRILKELSLYQYEQDGIVGREVLRGLVSFQKQWDLPITGYPDEKTLFLLCHLKGLKNDSRKKKKIPG